MVLQCLSPPELQNGASHMKRSLKVSFVSTRRFSKQRSSRPIFLISGNSLTSLQKRAIKNDASFPRQDLT